MVQTGYILGAAALAGLGQAAGAGRQGLTVHPVNGFDNFMQKVETGLNTVTGPRDDAPKSHSHNVVYVTQTTYYDANGGKQRRDDRSKYSSADLELASIIKPMLQSGHEQYNTMIKSYTDSNGNFEIDRAASNAAMGIQMYDMIVARGRNLQRKKRSVDNGVDVEGGHMLLELGARMLSEEGPTLGKRAAPSQSDLIKGLKPVLQLGYDAQQVLSYGNYDECALDAAHKMNAMADGTLNVIQFSETDASRQLASDIGPLFKYGKQQVDMAVKAYTSSDGTLDADRATADIIRGLQFAQRYGGRIGSRDIHETGHFLVDLGAEIMNGGESGLGRRDLNEEDLAKTIKPLLIKSHDIYVRLNQQYTDAGGNFDYDGASSGISQLMTGYSQEISDARAKKGNN